MDREYTDKIRIRDKENIKKEWALLFSGKPQGYAVRIPIGKELYPLGSPPDIEVVLLDSLNKEVAYRRVSNPVKGEKKKSEWTAASLDDAVNEAVKWEREMLEGAKK